MTTYERCTLNEAMTNDNLVERGALLQCDFVIYPAVHSTAFTLDSVCILTKAMIQQRHDADSKRELTKN
jgi:hypothetical protein